MSTRQTMTLTEFADAWGMGRTMAYELARRNELPVPVLKAGRRYFITRAASDAALAAKAEPSPPAPAMAAVTPSPTLLLDLLIGLRDVADHAIATLQAQQAGGARLITQGYTVHVTDHDKETAT